MSNVEEKYEIEWVPAPIVASAEFRGIGDVPRDGHGRWCKGSGCQQDIGVIATPDPALFGKAPPSQRVSAPDDWFASDDEFAAAQALATMKAENVPKPTRERILKNKEIAARAAAGEGRAGGELRGSSFVRRDRGEALFEEFGGKKRGYCPCTHCGIKVSPKGRGGFAHMEQDKILVLHEGGTYGTAKSFPNLIPSCGGCNRARGDTPYHVRPNWSPGKKAAATRRRGLAASAHFTSLVGEVVVAFPIGWDEEPDTDGEGPGVPVQGVLMVRTVLAWFGEYEQWIVGGEVVDPVTVGQVA